MISIEDQITEHNTKLDIADNLLSNFTLNNAKTIDDIISRVGQFVSQNKRTINEKFSAFCKRYEALKLRNKQRPTIGVMEAQKVLLIMNTLILRVSGVKKIERYLQLKFEVDNAIRDKEALFSKRSKLSADLKSKLNEAQEKLKNAYEQKPKAGDEERKSLIVEQKVVMEKFVDLLRFCQQEGENLAQAHENLHKLYIQSQELLRPAIFIVGDASNQEFKRSAAELQVLRNNVLRQLVATNTILVCRTINALQDAQRKLEKEKENVVESFSNGIVCSLEAVENAITTVEAIASQKSQGFAKETTVYDWSLQVHRANAACKEAREFLEKYSLLEIQPLEKTSQVASELGLISVDQQKSCVEMNQSEKAHIVIERDLSNVLQALVTQITSLNERCKNNKQKDGFENAIKVLDNLRQALDQKIVKYGKKEITADTFHSDCQEILSAVDRATLSSPRGDWSVTRGLDCLAKAIDSLIDRLIGQQPRNAVYGLFHRKTTSEKIFAQVEQALSISRPN